MFHVERRGRRGRLAAAWLTPANRVARGAPLVWRTDLASSESSCADNSRHDDSPQPLESHVEVERVASKSNCRASLQTSRQRTNGLNASTSDRTCADE